MNQTRMTRGKFERINACADEHGVIAAAAMDQRGSLQKSIAKARGGRRRRRRPLCLQDGRHRGPDAARHGHPHGPGVRPWRDPAARAGDGRAALLREDGLRRHRAAGRLPDLLPEWSVRRLLEAGADAIKMLLYYNADDEPGVNTIKQALVERIGAECAAWTCPSFWSRSTTTTTSATSASWRRRKPSKP